MSRVGAHCRPWNVVLGMSPPCARIRRTETRQWWHIMGDFFERIVDVEVTAAEAPRLAARLVDRLVAEGVLTAQLSAEGVYSLDADQGYVPGPNWATAVQHPGWDPGPVAVIVGPHAHCGGQGMSEAEFAECPRCDERIVIFGYPQLEPDYARWEPVTRAISAWQSTGTGAVRCGACEADGIPASSDRDPGPAGVSDWRPCGTAAAPAVPPPPGSPPNTPPRTPRSDRPASRVVR